MYSARAHPFNSSEGAEAAHLQTPLDGADQRRQMLTATDVMTSAVVTVRPDTPVHDIAKLLCERHISGVPVIGEGDRLPGIVSEGDLIGHSRVAGERRRSWWHTFLNDPAVLAQHYAKSHGRYGRGRHDEGRHHGWRDHVGGRHGPHPGAASDHASSRRARLGNSSRIVTRSLLRSWQPQTYPSR